MLNVFFTALYTIIDILLLLRVAKSSVTVDL
jgi:hypothetical protein